ncbi:MAG: hypothetical protein RLZZ399_2010, partial [Verrucomicrobiota bacterium]
MFNVKASLKLRIALLLTPLISLHAADRSKNQLQASAEVNRYISADGAPQYDRWVGDFYDSRFRLITNSVFSKQKHKFSGRIVVAQLRMWQVTGDERYLRRGREQFALMMEFAPGNDEILADCFGFYPVVLAGKLLKQAGQFDPAWETGFHACVVRGMEVYRKHRPAGDGNQDLARFCAIACALRLYPEEFIDFREPLEAEWEKMLRLGDLWLDSKTYTPVSVQYLVSLADELGRVDDLRQSEGFHRMFGNFRDVLSPNGFMPEFGHAYFRDASHPNWLYVFEWAAALYDDPSFLYASRKLFQRLVRFDTPLPKSLNEAFLSCDECLVGLVPSDRTELVTTKLDKCKSPPVVPS